jgi:hypothetical protein
MTTTTASPATLSKLVSRHEVAETHDRIPL